MITPQQTTVLDGDFEASGTEDSGELHLLVMSPDAFVSVPLPKDGCIYVGRSAKCEIRLVDPLASREHARLDVHPVEGGFELEIEDLGSANGTRVRDKPLVPRQAVPFLVGEAIIVGSTVLMVQQNRPALGSRRLWSHAYFESRLEDECARALPGAEFAMARIRLAEAIPWTRVVPLLVRNIAPAYLFAAYGPRDYEILFVGAPAQEVLKQMRALSDDLARNELGVSHGVSWYPRDGRSADALLARANALLKVTGKKSGTTRGVGEGHHGADVPSGAGMERLLDLARRAASRNINVLILGETGAGKDVLARAIHKLSGRKGDFVALNCAGLAPTLIESELFGYERGAFSGATTSRIGLLEAGNGGTVFLDEIGEMPHALQTRLLRALEAREVLPVGAVKSRPIDVRFLAATNRDLEAEVRDGGFRQDLFYRLNGISLAIPPLRARTDEIPALVDTFIAAVCVESGRADRPSVAPAAMDYLMAYAWPGNIRELKNAIERAMVLCDGGQILPEHLPLDKMRAQSDRVGNAERVSTHPSLPASSVGPIEEVAPPPSAADAPTPPWLAFPEKVAERERIVAALDAHAWSQTRASEFLGMSRRTFVTKLEYYRIPRPRRSR